MRPVELTLEGFKSYRDPVTFSFDQRGLFGIVGPTGAGKSTILDGIVYALYGETPRIRRSTRSLINSLEDQAKVNLVWEVGGKLWEVTRVLKRNGQSKVTLHPKGDQSDPITGESPVTSKIEELVGLDAAAFCSSVTLPQGDFDRFLRATPSERARILKGIFRLERVDLMRAEADARLRETDARIALLGESISSLPEDPDEAMKDLASQVDSAAKRALQIKESLPKVRQAETAIQAADRELEELQRRASEAVKASAEIPDVAELESLAERHGRARSGLAEASAEAKRAADSEVEARTALAETEAELGGQEWFKEVDAAIAESSRLDREIAKVAAALPALKAEVADLSASAQVSSDAAVVAERAVSDAEEALHAAHRAESSAVLRKALVKGEPCPVCDQLVESIPKAKKTPEVKAATAALQAAKQAAQQARSSNDEARRKLALAEQTETRSHAHLEELGQEASAVAATLTTLAGEGTDPVSEADRRKRLSQQARSALDTATKRREEATSVELSSRQELDKVTALVNKAVTTLSRVCGKLQIEAASFEAADLAGTAKVAVDAAAALRRDAGERIDALTERVSEARTIIERFQADYEVVEGSTAEDVYARAVARHEDLKRDMAEMQRLIDKAAAAREEVTRLSSSRSHHERLKSDLTDAKFTSYLLERQRRILSDLASEKFSQLTGHYTFDDEGDFQIVDVRTGTTRAPDTLSGGETFLASLALALALAEAVAQGGSSLDCFFLDEGFGSLDSESLDLALQGIESLASPGRLIGLISHLPGIQQGVGDLIVLDKTAEGSTVVLQHEGPLGYEAVLI